MIVSGQIRSNQSKVPNCFVNEQVIGGKVLIIPFEVFL
jgi:hypothetical protein